MKRFVSLILSVCFLFSINTVSYAANISSRKASNPVTQSMNDKYHVDFSGMSIDELNKFIDKMKDEDQTRACSNIRKLKEELPVSMRNRQFFATLRLRYAPEPVSQQ